MESVNPYDTLKILREANQSLMVRAQELQQENERLSEQLADVKATADRRIVTIADMEEKCQALAAELEVAKEGERWLRREYDMLAAQMEVVQLIFGGNKCGGCG